MAKETAHFSLPADILRTLRVLREWSKVDPETPNYVMSKLVEEGLKKQFLEIARGMTQFDEELRDRYEEYLENRKKMVEVMKDDSLTETTKEKKIQALKDMDDVLTETVIERMRTVTKEAIDAVENDENERFAAEELDEVNENSEHLTFCLN